MKASINGKIILPNEILEDKVLLYSNKIEGIVKADEVPKGAEIIDAKGAYVGPGLFDIHRVRKIQ